MRLKGVTDHDKINIEKSERSRIIENKQMYAGDYGKIKYRNAYGEERTRAYTSLNMLKVVAKRMSSLVFNENCEINITSESADEVSEFIQKTLKENDFYKNMERYLETMYALGGIVIKPYIDGEKIKLSWCTADTFFPLRSNSGAVSEMAIVSNHTKVEHGKTYYYTHFEFHEWYGDDYVVANELYRTSNKNEVGDRVGLTHLFEGLEEQTIYTGFKRPLFVHVKPAEMNNIELWSALGLGICDNAKTTLEQINKSYDAFHREIVLGGKKIIVSDHFIKQTQDEKGNERRVLDADTDVYEVVPGDMDRMTYDEKTFSIRSEEYISSINYFLRTLETQTGMSAGTFSFDGASVKTATEIVSENSLTYQTRNSQVEMVGEGIKGLVQSIIQLAKHEKIYTGTDEYDIEIDFDDGVFTDKNVQLEYYGKANTLGLMPKEEVMQRVFGITEQEAKEWIAQIKEEQDQYIPPIESQSSMLYLEE